jgi:hypothetical protein
MSAAEKLEPRAELEAVRVPTAKQLQRRGLTFTEIAKSMNVERQAIVDALYWGVCK